MKHADALPHLDATSSQADQDTWLSAICSAYSEPQAALIKHAFTLTFKAQTKDHPMPNGLDVAALLKQIHVDAETLTAALLSDPRVMEGTDLKAIPEAFPEVVIRLTENVNRLNHFRDYSEAVLEKPEQAEALRRMLLAMVQDVRAVIIRLAYRIQRLKNITSESYEMRQYIARETLDIYAPLANRMGIAQLKWELEDLAFRHLDPQTYKKIAKQLTENRKSREAYLDIFIQDLEEKLAQEKIEAEVSGRPKHIYSIWRKMQKKNLAFEELYDLRAVRIITKKLASCYEILGLVHSNWQYLPREFDDYIANPKENGYQSLHTVVVGPNGATVEVQIRTEEMHQFAELGVAAHWRYKEGSQRDQAVEKTIESIRRILDDKADDDGLFEGFQTELYADRIFVLTPKGEIKDLMKGATPLDFAYAIHTEVGHRCRGAKIDGRIVPLTTALKSGQRVEILTTKEGGPNRSWLDPNMGYLTSGHALNKVRAWFRQQDHDKNLVDGKAILERERQCFDLEKIDLKALSAHFHLNREDDVLIRLGRGDISQGQLITALGIEKHEVELPVKRARQNNRSAPPNEIKVQGVGNILTQFAKCCQPVPGDDIVGFIAVGKGITIHRKSCVNILSLEEDQKNRLIEVSWGEEEKSISTQIEIEAFDRQGLLRDITQLMSNTKANILSMTTNTDKSNYSVKMHLTVEVKNTAHLATILHKLSQVPNLISARRLGQIEKT